MLNEIMHVGITVSDMDRSIAFYRDILGLSFQGELVMQGKETDLLFDRENCKVRVAYLNGNDNKMAPPVELIQFVGDEVDKTNSDLHRTSISEICFKVLDIDEEYQKLIKQGVECLSEPQYFDFTDCGFGKSKALYFKDPDGIILELMQMIEE